MTSFPSPGRRSIWNFERRGPTRDRLSGSDYIPPLQADTESGQRSFAIVQKGGLKEDVYTADALISQSISGDPCLSNTRLGFPDMCHQLRSGDAGRYRLHAHGELLLPRPYIHRQSIWVIAITSH